MMKKNDLFAVRDLFVVLLLVTVLAGLTRADVQLPAVIDSHMVLQRDMPLPIWGKADPGEAVSVRLDNKDPVKTKADDKGAWKVVLPPVKADGKPVFSKQSIGRFPTPGEVEDLIKELLK